MKSLPILHHGVAALALGTILAGSPFALSGDVYGPAFEIAKAFAKNGGDDGGGRGGDDNGGNSGRGGGGDDDGGRGGDDNGGNSGRGGGDDRDDSGGRGGDGGRNDDSGRGGDDDRDDDSRGRGGDDRDDDGRGRGGDDDRDDDSRGRGADDRGAVGRGGSVGGGGGLQVVKVERSGGSVEVVYSNGFKEEVENGRYELKNAAGRTIVERPATAADLGRIAGNVRNSRLPAAPQPRLPVGSQAASIEVGRGAIEVRYTTGWKEEISAGRYELKDPNNNTVVERPATQADRRRLRALAGS